MPQTGQTTPTGGRSQFVYETSGAARAMPLPADATLNFVGVYCWEQTTAFENDLRAAVYDVTTGDKLHETNILANAISSNSSGTLFDAHIPFPAGTTLSARNIVVVVSATGRGGVPIVNGSNGPGGSAVGMGGTEIYPTFPANFAGFLDTTTPQQRDIYLDYTPLPPGMSAAATVVSAAAAAVSTEIRMGASAAGIASSSAALLTAIRLAADAISVSAAAGTLNSGALLQASAIDVVNAVATLTAAVRFNADAAGTASASGGLTNWASVTLSGELYHGQGGVLDPNFWMDSTPTDGTTIYYDATRIQIYPNGEISSDTNNCAALMQFFDGSSWAVGLLVITPQLVAYADDIASASAQLSTAIELVAAASALASVSAAFSTGAGFAGQATDIASASGSLVTGIPMSALASNVSGAAANLTTAIRLQANALDVAAATADFNGRLSIDAAATAVASALGNLTSQIRLGVVASGQATAAGSMTTAIRAAASAQDIASAGADLVTAIRLGGSANSIASSSGDLSTGAPLFAAALDVATAIATISTGISLRANVQAIAQSNADLGSAIRLLANAFAESRASAVLTDVIETPPIGIYPSDPRYVVSKSRWSFSCGKTPRFMCKDPIERVVLTFDFSAVLAPDESLDGPITLTIAATSGTDVNPRDLFDGYPAYDMTKRRILQPIKGGISGRDYFVKVAAATSNKQKSLALAALLPVRG